MLADARPPCTFPCSLPSVIKVRGRQAWESIIVPLKAALNRLDTDCQVRITAGGTACAMRRACAGAAVCSGAAPFPCCYRAWLQHSGARVARKLLPSADRHTNRRCALDPCLGPHMQIEAAEVFAQIARERLMSPMDLQAGLLPTIVRNINKEKSEEVCRRARLQSATSAIRWPQCMCRAVGQARSRC